MQITTHNGVAKLNGRGIGYLKRHPIRRLGWEANVDRLTRPYEPVHSRPTVCERWNYRDEAFANRADAVAWIQRHADEIAAEFPARFGLGESS